MKINPSSVTAMNTAELENYAIAGKTSELENPMRQYIQQHYRKIMAASSYSVSSETFWSLWYHPLPTSASHSLGRSDRATFTFTRHHPGHYRTCG